MKLSLSKLGVLSDRDLDWINATGITKSIAKGEILIRQTQPIDELYILLAGTLTVFVSSSEQENNRSEREIATIASGEIVGEISFVDNQRALTTIKATEKANLLILSFQQLENKIQQDEGFAARFYQTISAQLSHKLRRVSALLVKNKVISEPPLRKVLFVFAILDDSDIDWMIESGMQVNASAGKILIQQGEPVEAVYILIDGTLAVSVTLGEGNSRVTKDINQLSSGEIVGEMSFVETGKASATVASFEESLLLAIPQQQLAAKLKQDMQFAARFYRAIAVVLADRLRGGLIRHGYAQNTDLDGDIEYEGELDLDMLQQTALAGTRFNWMARRVSGNNYY
ncbi:cyclic nucleotide-binding domain-containing protein [Aerosakkonema funiforme]|uniref:Cyclic nucleotide-binding domain-containing protein n=3 Tax=Oscillatoriophycideae TaxID=1301283 RepID=A0A926VE58_9CYAN|nr:cyclic nucleotide-binding domain-containing protein [Aerosakkonema funiforme]MBD2181935.1 cyclic nucleotide-binding domain-containing protein [Aerosakkonema funiforme FACHB-1375]